MAQGDFPIIPHEVEGKLIHQRASDGYINATAMCAAAKKQMGHYLANAGTKEFLKELSDDTHAVLVNTIQGGLPELQGTWVHPQVAIHLAQWLSPKFAVQVSKWVYEWIAGGAVAGNRLPVHLQRYMVNLAEIPRTHFSMLNEITFALIAPLEADGYTLPEKLIPDISEGRMFSEWLRGEGIEPSKFPTYKHRYLDGRVVDARLYPNEYLPLFRAHFHSIWMPKKCEEYFKQRDAKALKYLPKLLKGPDN